MKDVVIGIDIGGTFTKYGIVDRQGHLYGDGTIPTETTEVVDDYLDRLSGALEKLKGSVKDNLNIKGIGIGAPNGNYYKGTIEFAPNLKWKGVVKFTEMFKKYYDIPIVLTNDANAAALGEMIFGGAKKMKDFILITLGTGLGSGLVVNGELVNGHDGFAGELGHITVKPEGRHCGCGRRGCLETYVSAQGIKRTLFELLAEQTDDSEFRDISFNDLSAEMISKAANSGDVIALNAFDITGEILASKLADSIAHTSPEAIFIFGGLAKAGDLLFNPVKYYLERKLLPIYKNKVKILPSGLTDKNAAVLGASALIWKELDNM